MELIGERKRRDAIRIKSKQIRTMLRKHEVSKTKRQISSSKRAELRKRRYRGRKVQDGEAGTDPSEVLFLFSPSSSFSPPLSLLMCLFVPGSGLSFFHHHMSHRVLPLLCFLLWSETFTALQPYTCTQSHSHTKLRLVL